MKTTVESVLAACDASPEGEQFSPTRYPYTYACDFLRQHPEVVPREAIVAANRNLVETNNDGLGGMSNWSRSPAPSPDALGDPEGAEEAVVARDRARQTDPLSSFDPNRLRDLLGQVTDHRGGWDNVSNDDLAEVQRTLLADAAYLSGVPARTEP